MGKAIPYGICNLPSDNRQVNAVPDHDTTASAVEPLRGTAEVLDA